MQPAHCGVQVHIRDAAVTVFTRRGNDWTKRFKKIADDTWHIGAGSAIIDGEVVAPAADGTTDFSVLQNDVKGRSTKIVMVAFDLLYINGHDRSAGGIGCLSKILTAPPRFHF